MWLTQLVARALRAAGCLVDPCRSTCATARWGEMEAYFYLRSLGYRIVARNYRSRPVITVKST